MKTKLWAIGLMVICTLFTSAAQLFYKTGANNLEFNLISIISNWPIFLGMFLYGIGAVLLIIALKGGEVTVLYPIVASSYIWVALGSGYLFKEIITPLRWIGIILIIIGILMINFGQENKTIKYTEPV